MKYSVVVVQDTNDIRIETGSEQMGERLKKSAAIHAFPTGSDWREYAGARSFRFIPIAYRNYLLSYTLVLRGDEGEWPGQLRAWGLVGPLETFLVESSLANRSPREIFMTHSDLFETDEQHAVMLKGLEAGADAAPQSFDLPWLLRLFWRKQKAVISWRFSEPDQWANIEALLYGLFRHTLRFNRHFRKDIQLKTFSTFALSPSEPAEILGLPSTNLLIPRFGFVSGEA